MSNPNDNSFDTPALHSFLRDWQAGDRAAADALIRGAGSRLERLARRMYRGFPNVRDLADTGDILQNSLLRLLRSLEKMRPATTRDFFNLAAVHIRRELLDLARQCRRRRPVPLPRGGGPDSVTAVAEPAAPVADDLDLWVRFHEEVDELPPHEREVIGLVFYHGWTQTQIATLIGRNERTIRRWWTSGCERLRARVGGSVAG
jgi:RNA polymerase sigma factor (sigma-70 family)